LDLTAQVGSGQDTITTQLEKLELMLKGQAWETPRNATITYADKYLDIDNFFLKQGDQEIALSTGRDGDKTDLKIMIEQLRLNPLFSALDMEDYQVEGTLYGEAEVLDMFTPGPVDANFRISQLAVQDTVLGNVAMQFEKGIPVSESEDIIDVLLTLQGKSNDLKVEGEYNLAAGPDEEALDFQVDLTRLTLDDWQPLAQDFLKELSGTLRADMTIKGSTTKPKINGNFTFADEVFITPVATGARIYAENQQIEFTGDGMVFDQFTLLDSARTPAVLDGTVTFADLANLRVDLTFDTEHFIFVSSEEYDNEAFYGRAVASSNLSISGPVDEVTVSGNLAVEEGTVMTLALVSGPEEAAQAGFLNFVDVSEFAKADTVLQDSLSLVSASTKTDSVELSGFILSTEVQVDPEARFTVVIDPVNGDRLEVAGEGDLKVDQNLQGDLTMQGTFTINSGGYLLNFAKVIKKEFTVRDGSFITWSGDPANAAMDITAVYTVEEASLADLVKVDNSKVKAEVPANVLLTVGGYLENPELSFGLEIPDVESLDFSTAEQIKAKISQMDDTDLYKNVFGLIVLGRFIPQEGGGQTSSTGGGTADAVNDQINNSVSQLLTSQLSRLSEDYLGGVEIDVGLEENQAGGSGVAGRDIDVALSKELFDDRLTVTVGGTTAGGQGSAGSGFAGEFQVLYRITEDGNLNLKAFQNSERNQLTGDIQQNAGVSLLYQSSFDKFFAGEEETLKSRSLEDQESPKEAAPPASQRTTERRAPEE
ncbi:MAG: translocation/assembly module TamB domain-containing protein, partial [Tunicatimonas sp.]